MKKLLYLLLVIPLLFSASCSDESDNHKEDNSLLLGSWSELFERELFELVFYDDNTGVMNVYVENRKDDTEDFTYTFDKEKMQMLLIFNDEPELPILYDVKISKGLLILDCISGDFEDFKLHR